MLKRLSSDFIDVQVVHATGIEKDIVECCYEFCSKNIPNFQTYGIAEDMKSVLNDTMDYENIAYFTFEFLQDFMDSIAPTGCYFGSHQGDATMGYWKISNDDILDYNEQRLSQNSNIFIKLLFIAENGQSKELQHYSLATLDQLAHQTIELDHDITFGQCAKQANEIIDRDSVAEYIYGNPRLLNWVIEKVYWADYKDTIGRVLGNQDITALFLDILAHDDSGSIDSIDQDVYGLRETCPECQNLEFDEADESDCVCQNFSDVNNVWIISDKSFFESLQEVGAMTYETDSLYLYMQTDYSGNYYDSLLRRAWLDYAWLGRML